METTITSPLSPSDAGCWYDSHRGYAGITDEVICDATAKGFQSGSLSTPEDIDWECERATDYLNDLAPEGFWIGWHDGDFGMWEMDAESLDETPEDYPCLF